MLYIVVFFYLLLNVYIYDINVDVNAKKFKRINIFISYLILALIAGFRYRLAPDTVAYQYFVEYQVIGFSELDYEYIFSQRFQPIWVLLSSFSKSLGSYLYLQLFVSFFTVFTLYFFNKRNTKYVSTATLFFYISFYHYFTMEVLREALAVSIFLWSMMLFNKRKFASFVLIVITFFVHKFAIFTLFIYLFLLLNMRYRSVIILMSFVSLFFIYLKDPIQQIQLAYSIINNVNFSNYDITSSLSVTGYIYYAIKCILPFFLVFYCVRNKIIVSNNIKNNIFFTFLAIYITIYVIRIFSFPFIERLANYFILFYIVFSSSLLIVYFKRKSRIIRNTTFIFIVISVTIYSWYPLTKVDAQTGIPAYVRYYPYYSFFNKKTNPAREELTRLEAKEK